MRLGTILGLSAATAVVVAPVDAAQTSAAIDVPAGPLSQALNNVARQTGAELVFLPEAVRGISSPRLRGRMTVEVALTRLLSRTNLIFRRSNSGVYIVEVRSGAASEIGPGSAPTADDEPPVPEILVIGRRTQNLDIRRLENDVQAYQVVSRADLAKAHRDNLGQFFHNRVTANTLATPPSLELEGETRSEIDLRGLGPDSTLLLIDGRRIPSVPGFLFGFHQPDLNAVPLQGIERVEILTGTAGGLQGFGALGGVANVVLRRDTRGAEIHATSGLSARGTARRLGVEGRVGVSFNEEQTVAMLHLGRTWSERLKVGDRNFADRTLERSFQEAPEEFIDFFTFGSGVAVFSADQTSDLTFKPEFGGTALDSRFSHIPAGFEGGAGDLAAILMSRAGVPDLSISAGEAESDLTSTPTTSSAIFSIRHRFGPGVEAFLDGLVLRNEGRYTGHQSFGVVLLAPNSPRNPFEQPIYVTFPTPQKTLNKRKAINVRRLTAGLVASLPLEWRGTAEASFGLARLDSRTFEDLYFTNRLELFGEPGGPTGSVLDPLGSWSQLQSDIAATRGSLLTGISTKNHSNEQSVRLAGPVFRSTAGDSMLTVSLLRRREDVRPHSRLTIATFAGEKRETKVDVAERSNRTRAISAELRAPIFGPSGPLPLLHGLELQLAARHDLFEAVYAEDPLGPEQSQHVRRRFSGSAFTVGGKAFPWPGLMLRASYAVGLQPPSLGSLIGSELEGPGFVFQDPKRGGSFLGSEVPYLLKFGAPPGLRSSRASTLSVGAVLQPHQNWPRLTIDYYRIVRRRDPYEINDANFVLENEDVWPERVVREPLTDEDRARGFTGGVITILDAQSSNGSSRIVEALDMKIDWSARLLGGEVRAYGSSTLQRRNADRGEIGPSVSRVAYREGPLKWRANGGIDWTGGSTNIGFNVQYFDRYRLAPIGPLDPRSALAVKLHGSKWVGAQLFVDLYASKKFHLGGPGSDKMFKVALGVNNIFDRSPAAEMGFLPPERFRANPPGKGYSRYGDPRRRRFELALSSEF